MRSDQIKKGLKQAPARAMLRAVGVGDEDFGRPFVGVVNTFTDGMPCNFHLRELAQHLKAGRSHKQRQRPVAKLLLEVAAADHVDVKSHHLALGPEALDLAAQGSVVATRVDLFPLEEFAPIDARLKVFGRQKVVVDFVLFASAWSPRRRRNTERQPRKLRHQPAHQRGFAGARRSRKNEELAGGHVGEVGEVGLLAEIGSLAEIGEVGSLATSC